MITDTSSGTKSQRRAAAPAWLLFFYAPSESQQQDAKQQDLNLLVKVVYICLFRTDTMGTSKLIKKEEIHSNKLLSSY